MAAETEVEAEAPTQVLAVTMIGLIAGAQALLEFHSFLVYGRLALCFSSVLHPLSFMFDVSRVSSSCCPSVKQLSSQLSISFHHSLLSSSDSLIKTTLPAASCPLHK